MYVLPFDTFGPFSADELKTLVEIEFSEEGSNLRRVEEQTWIHFVNFLDQCEGGYLLGMLANGSLKIFSFLIM